MNERCRQECKRKQKICHCNEREMKEKNEKYVKIILIKERSEKRLRNYNFSPIILAGAPPTRIIGE